MEEFLIRRASLLHTELMRQGARQDTKEDNRDRTTVMLDPDLMAAAKKALKTETNSETIEKALRVVVQQQAQIELAELIMVPDPTFTAAPRRKPQ